MDTICPHCQQAQSKQSLINGCCSFCYQPIVTIKSRDTRHAEAGRGALQYASTQLKPPRIVAGVHPENLASRQVLLKLGFVDKGLVWFADTQAYEPFFEFQP